MTGARFEAVTRGSDDATDSPRVPGHGPEDLDQELGCGVVIRELHQKRENHQQVGRDAHQHQDQANRQQWHWPAVDAEGPTG